MAPILNNHDFVSVSSQLKTTNFPFVDTDLCETPPANLKELKYFYLKNGSDAMLLGEFDLAIESFDRAINLDPKLGLAYNDKGVALFKLDNLDEALTCLDVAISLQPNDTNSLVNKAAVLEALGYLSEASKCFDLAIEIDPNLSSSNRALEC